MLILSENNFRRIEFEPPSIDGEPEEVFGITINAAGQMRLHVLVEMRRNENALKNADKLRHAIAEALGDQAAEVARLGRKQEVEVTGMDGVTTKEEVLDALLTILPSGYEGSAASAKAEVKFTAMWPTIRGEMVTTVEVPYTWPTGERKVRIGWTLCSVRPRCPPPLRCHRCRGYGHSAYNCKENDLSEACRKCGVAGHRERVCTADETRCVTCERIEAKHRPGFGACAARRAAVTRSAGGERPN